MTLEVIGAGFGRTGTLSLKRALELLGFGPCCHGSDERHFGQGEDFWQRALDGEPIDWDEFFRGYRSTVDSPSCKFSVELAQRFPAAKVILTWREPNDWVESYQETILPLIASAQGGRHLRLLFGSSRLTRETLIAAYERHNAEVRRLIAPERLLIYEAQQGWQPLCEFLGVATPQMPFPRANLRADFPLVLDELLARQAQHRL